LTAGLAGIGGTGSQLKATSLRQRGAIDKIKQS